MSDTALISTETATRLESEALDRRRSAFRLAAAVCAFFFPLPILGIFTSVLDGTVVRGVSWAWIYAFAQFAVAAGQHVVASLFPREVAAPRASITPHHPAPVGRPLCPACQVARQGAVQPAVERLALLPLLVLAATEPANPSSIPTIFLFHPSGRDPPRG